MDGRPLVSPAEARQTAVERLKPARRDRNCGIKIALVGLAIGIIGVGLPILFSMEHAKGNIYVSLMQLIASPIITLHGLATAFWSSEKADRYSRAITWICFFTGVLLCICVFVVLFSKGFSYR